MTWQRMLRLSAVLLTCGSLSGVWAQETAQQFRFETQHVDAYFAQRAGALAAALGFAAWPQTTELYMAPPVGRALLREPARVAEEVRSCTTVRFGDEPWPQCTWSWKAVAEGRKPSPADSLDLQITVAPSGRAAQEYLLSSLADNMLPTEGLVAIYKAAKRPEGLGTLAFRIESPRSPDTRLWFIRANVVFRLRGEGALSAEVLPLASRLDEQLLGQQPLTLEELRARRQQMRVDHRP
jgi:hypothetical protein